MIIISKFSDLPFIETDFTGSSILVDNTPQNIWEKSEAFIHTFLNDKERRMIERLPMNSQVRADRLWTRILLKKLYAKRYNIEEKDMKDIAIINRNEVDFKGLPYMKHKDVLCPFHLSISHCDGRVGVALRTKPCGIDVVKLFTRKEHMEETFLDYGFSEAERLQLSGKTEVEKLESLTFLWGIKEAVSKYLGCGLVYGPGTVEVLFHEKKSVNVTIHPKVRYSGSVNDLKIYYYWNKHRTFCHVFVE